MQQKRARRRGSGDVTIGLTGVSATATAGRLTIGTTSVATRLADGWEVIFHLGRTAHGRYDVTRLEVRPAGGAVPEGGVTTKVIRAITIAAARRYARGTPLLPPASGRGPATTRGQVLARYAQLVRVGHPEAAKTVAAECHINRSTVRSWIHRATAPPDSARRSAHRR